MASIEDDPKFDGVFMSVIQQKQGINGFFGTIFSFLRRSTDFFQDQKQAEKVMIEECTKQFKIFEKDQKLKLEKEKEKKAKEEQLKREKEEKLKKEQQKQQEAKIEKPVEQVIPQKVEVPVQQKVDQNQEKKEEISTENSEKKEEEDTTPPPVGNGGKNDKYIWTQTLEELHLHIPIPDNIRAKDLNIKIEPTTLLVQIKGQEPIINGEWTENVVSDSQVWVIEDGQFQDYNGKYIHISIDKWKNQWHWWSTPIKGDPAINTQKIQPENSKLSDLDGETRSTVEKMMEDMKRKQMGKPSTDEEKKQEMLQNFMKQHPEMDFSKCKFN